MSIEVSPRDFRDGGRYKYVRFADSAVTFCDAANPNASHQQLVDCYLHSVVPVDPLNGQKVPAVSAGTIRVQRKVWHIEHDSSFAANLSRFPSDEKYIKRELDKHDLGFRLGQPYEYE